MYFYAAFNFLQNVGWFLSFILASNRMCYHENLAPYFTSAFRFSEPLLNFITQKGANIHIWNFEPSILVLQERI